MRAKLGTNIEHASPKAILSRGRDPGHKLNTWKETMGKAARWLLDNKNNQLR